MEYKILLNNLNLNVKFNINNYMKQILMKLRFMTYYQIQIGNKVEKKSYISYAPDA